MMTGLTVSAKDSEALLADAASPLFGNIESAQEYVALLCEALDEAEQTIQQEIASPLAITGARHLDALRLVDYKLKILRQHFVASRRLLTDLRTLRRYLLDERAPGRFGAENTVSESQSLCL
jgi:hypothetical protein